MDLINHPPHYKVGGYECLDIIEALGLGYHLGNALKYIWRSGRKFDRIEDLKKARFYIDRAIRLAEEEQRRCLKCRDVVRDKECLTDGVCRVCTPAKGVAK